MVLSFAVLLEHISGIYLRNRLYTLRNMVICFQYLDSSDTAAFSTWKIWFSGDKSYDILTFPLSLSHIPLELTDGLRLKILTCFIESNKHTSLFFL